jgi:hypothetical protein
LGEDWLEKSLAIDELLEAQGMDLLEEAVYLLFSTGPLGILKGEGGCLIARSVIGPKKKVAPPLALIDWKASEVWRENIEGESLRQLVESAGILKSHISSTSNSFIICVRRELRPNLSLKVEVIFHE